MPDMLAPAIAAVATGGVVTCLWGRLVETLKATGGSTATALRAELVAAGMNPAPLPVYLLAWRGLALGSFVVLAGPLGMPPVAAVLAVIAYLTAPWWVRGRIRAYRRRVNEQVAGVARNLAGQVRVGLPLNEALAAVSRDAPAPFGGHLRQTARGIAQGQPVRVALEELKGRVRVEAVTTMTVALQVAEEKGGKLADVLDRVAGSAEELSRVEKKRETDTAAGRLMVTLMAAFPAAFLGFIYALDPDLIGTMFTTFAGQVVLAVVAAIVYVSIRWASRILARVE